MLHILKLAVGAKDVADLRRWQAGRIRFAPPLRHQTRSMPRRRDEVIAGGSLFWVIAGFVQVRQRLVDMIDDRREGDVPCCGLVLDHELVPVEVRAVKAFQGWRYLEPKDAPEDVDEATAAQGTEALPEHLMRALREARLI